ncbi:uncharacterized protein LOC114299648 [Camellia sinensis]|uniref:uncharacterized protein LOC114299648 n=1 Tax=Camellia sinensis TaxID=4442 RepID=UPI0010356DFD|nr:uncharacterized protein LOC114299648 [Camellia sinensis]
MAKKNLCFVGSFVVVVVLSLVFCAETLSRHEFPFPPDFVFRSGTTTAYQRELHSKTEGLLAFGTLLLMLVQTLQPLQNPPNSITYTSLYSLYLYIYIHESANEEKIETYWVLFTDLQDLC